MIRKRSATLWEGIVREGPEAVSHAVIKKEHTETETGTYSKSL